MQEQEQQVPQDAGMPGSEAIETVTPEGLKVEFASPPPFWMASSAAPVTPSVLAGVILLHAQAGVVEENIENPKVAAKVQEFFTALDIPIPERLQKDLTPVGQIRFMANALTEVLSARIAQCGESLGLSGGVLVDVHLNGVKGSVLFTGWDGKAATKSEETAETGPIPLPLVSTTLQGLKVQFTARSFQEVASGLIQAAPSPVTLAAAICLSEQLKHVAGGCDDHPEIGKITEAIYNSSKQVRPKRPAGIPDEVAAKVEMAALAMALDRTIIPGIGRAMGMAGKMATSVNWERDGGSVEFLGWYGPDAKAQAKINSAIYTH